MRFITIIFYLVLIIFGVSFAALNSGSVTVNFYFTQFTSAISIVLLCAFGLGMLFGLLLFSAKYLHARREVRKARHQLQMTEKELNNLRVMPLKDQH